MALEIERKYLDIDIPALRHRLTVVGGQTTGAHFESNRVFDTAGQELFHSGRLLRLRCQEWPGKTRYVLTLKLPIALSPTDSRCKIREERELSLDDAAGLSAILEGLGYTEQARYEKVREVWLLSGVEAALDILPFGAALELEGAADMLDLAGNLLGLDKVTISTKSYHELHQEWRKRHDLPPDLSFVFTAEQRTELRKSLGLVAAKPA
ncbi:MAG: class IV adenylate cyclase [Desulfovibrio sp.]|nr:class IV adenylate cyclase [Desulfovibrio sp.]